MNAPVQGHERLATALRVLLAGAGLLLFASDPTEPRDIRPFGIGVLAGYLAYAIVLWVVSERSRRSVPAMVAPWIDIAWVTLLVGVSSGTSDVAYPLYLFPILVAAFGMGFRGGLAVLLASTAAFFVVGVLTFPRVAGHATEIEPYLSRPLTLLALGYLIVGWGGHEVRQRAQLALLGEITALSGSRAGIEGTLTRLLATLREFYGAETCLVVVAEGEPARCWMRSVTTGRPGAAPEVALPGELAALLLSPGAAAFAARRRRLGGALVELVGASEGAGPRVGVSAEGLLDALDGASLASVPVRYHANANARLYVVRGERHPLDRRDTVSLLHVAAQMAPVLENVRLVDRLAEDAAEEQRRRIARDLHDSVIQPYLGLRLGLGAAERALAAGRAGEGAAQVSRLVALADGEIETLRGYVRTLREGGGASAAGLLGPGLERFCSRFSEATGIRVEVSTEGDPVRDDRIAAEVFQMIAEGLSNVRRHTEARGAEIRIRVASGRLHLTIANDRDGEPAPEFFPRSIGERAAALGGTARVEPASGRTAVQVEIPL